MEDHTEPHRTRRRGPAARRACSGRPREQRPAIGKACHALAVAALALCAPLPVAAQAITVQEQTRPKGLWDPLLGMFVHTAATADVNGDGWPDLFVGGFYKDLPWNLLPSRDPRRHADRARSPAARRAQGIQH